MIWVLTVKSWRDKLHLCDYQNLTLYFKSQLRKHNVLAITFESKNQIHYIQPHQWYQSRIQTGFHHFMEISQIFHD